MDIDNASLAMAMLRAASEQNEATQNTPSDNTNLHTLPLPTEYVSQFRIDGQPILPPLMTAEKRQLMRQLRQKALQLETKRNKPRAVNKISSSDERCCDTSSICSWNNTDYNGSHCSIKINDSDMDSTQRLPKLQQTATYIYDNKLKPQELIDQLNSPRNRPQTLQIQSQSSLTANAIPTICVNPPTPLCSSRDPEEDQGKQPGTPGKSSKRKLGTHHRKLNSITTRILQFEDPEQGMNRLHATKMLWQNDKRMHRSCTSPLLNSAQLNMPPLHRSRSFTLDHPSQALVDHMQRESETDSILSSALETQLRYRPMLPDKISACSSTQSLDLWRRDTVESKAKQVQRSASSSFLETVNSAAATGKYGGTSLSLQNSVEKLLQQALQEKLYAISDISQLESKQLEIAKQRMFKDIKSVHRDRFKQLVQYQHEEQRRMQQEFDRQQKFLIEQICLEINACAYTNDAFSRASNQPVASVYTSTDDLQTPSQSSPTKGVRSSMDSPQNYAEFNHMLDTEAPTDIASSPRSMLLRSRNVNNSMISNSSKIKKPVPRIDLRSPGSRKASSPMTSVRLPSAKKATNKTTAVTTKTNARSQHQQRLQQHHPLTAQAQSNGSPIRQTHHQPANDVEKRRHVAATILTAAIRGYLVRRLFRTEQVQRIVQTIRDTLIFVLNLHMETYSNSSDREQQTNVQLKARLLQQLCSASRTLHLIFFQTSIKERMEIISRDRKRIKTKLLEMHVKHRH